MFSITVPLWQLASLKIKGQDRNEEGCLHWSHVKTRSFI